MGKEINARRTWKKIERELGREHFLSPLSRSLEQAKEERLFEAGR